MTRPPSQSTAASTPRAGRIAAVQTDPDGGLVILIAETRGPEAVVAEVIRTDRAQAPEVLRSRKIDLVLRVVPATQTVCRVIPAPEVTSTDRSAVADALGLLAESELPASLPWHRRSAGMIRLGNRQAALLTGWVRLDKDPDDSTPLSGVPEVWVAEIAALAALGQAAGASGVIGLAEQRLSAISLLAIGPKRPIGRVLRLPSTGAEWPETVRRAWSETAAAAGIEAPCPAADGLLMDLAPTVRLAGGNRDRQWINRHGLALGALLLYGDADAAVSSLVGLTPDEPRRAMPFAQRAVDWLSRPRNAAMSAAACIAVLLFAPWGAAEARYSILRAEAGSLDDLDRRLSEAERRIEFYRLLNQKRWPMTKLLADIAGAAPVGVTLESVELAQGEAISIRATAESSELVTAFRKNLGDTNVFTAVATPTIDASSDGVTFQLQARLAPSGAITISAPIEDFAAKSLAQRLYGDAAATSPGWSTDDSDVDHRDRRSDDRRSAPPSRGRDEPGRAATRTERAPAAAPAAVIPPPLSDADIAAMDRTTAMKEWGVRKKASTQPGIDAATKERLAAEAEKCRARMQSAGGGA